MPNETCKKCNKTLSEDEVKKNSCTSCEPFTPIKLHDSLAEEQKPADDRYEVMEDVEINLEFEKKKKKKPVIQDKPDLLPPEPVDELDEEKPPKTINMPIPKVKTEVDMRLADYVPPEEPSVNHSEPESEPELTKRELWLMQGTLWMHTWKTTVGIVFVMGFLGVILYFFVNLSTCKPTEADYLASKDRIEKTIVERKKTVAKRDTQTVSLPPPSESPPPPVVKKAPSSPPKLAPTKPVTCKKWDPITHTNSKYFAPETGKQVLKCGDELMELVMLDDIPVLRPHYANPLF